MKIFQKTMTTSISVDKNDTVYSLSVKGVSGVTTVTTNGVFKGIPSGGIDFAENQGQTFAADIRNPLEGLTITTTGSYDVTILIY